MGPQAEPDRKDVARARTLTVQLGEFSSRAGHDLLGPLNQASSLLALFIQRHDTEVNPDARILLEFLQTSAARMQDVVIGVQSYLQIAAAAPDFEAVDMNTAVASAQLRLAKAIAESSAVITPDALPVISAVADQMATLFEILIANSIRFRRQRETPRIRICSGQAAGNWIFTVEDNGIGIDTEYREAVFLPFRRLNGKEYPGAGMGLATAKLIVELHGGKIWIEPASGSEAPYGTAVLFTVPVSA
ncbi:MAG: ATP-binding protein [Bryobacteraceae bacterium]|jgi:chemotaxis family two-component system sensor kinase Cph1